MNDLSIQFRGEGVYAGGSKDEQRYSDIGAIDFHRVSVDVPAETQPVAYGDESKTFLKTRTFSIALRDGLIYPVIETVADTINSTHFTTVNGLTFKVMNVKQLQALISKLDVKARTFTLDAFRELLAPHITPDMLKTAKINARDKANTTPAVKQAREAVALIEIA